MLTQMVKAIAHTRSLQWLRDAVVLLDQEYEWFQRHHLVQGTNLSRYLPDDAAPLPRPESYREDEAVVKDMPPSLRNFTLGALIGGAESGWDFSSRWIRNNGVDLRDIATQNVLPVCLNSILYSNERILADLHLQLSMHESSPSPRLSDLNRLDHALKSQSYIQRSQQRAASMLNLMWSAPQSQWRDSCTTPPCPQLTSEYASSVMPLWAGLGLGPNGSTAAVVDFVRRLLHDGGVATSTVISGMQWDGDNAWPPLQFFTSAALRSLADTSATELAAQVERAYLTAAQHSWKANGTLFEKYSAAVNGASGGGGEYVPQTGFGWSAGVAVAFILADLQPVSPPATQLCSAGNGAWVWGCWTGVAQVLVVVASVLVGVCVGVAVFARWRGGRKKAPPVSTQNLLVNSDQIFQYKRVQELPKQNR